MDGFSLNRGVCIVNGIVIFVMKLEIIYDEPTFMRISIITASLNREKTVRDTIESVQVQDYPLREYVVIDGGSSDKTLEIIGEYKEVISTLITGTDNGMYEAINKGLRATTGDVVGLLHSDDLFYGSEVLSQIAACFEKTGADLVYGNGIYVDPERPERIIRNWISGPFDRRKIPRGWLPLHPTVYIKRTCIEQLGGYREDFRIAADSEFLLRYLYKGELKVAYLNEYVVRMRMGGASTAIGNTWRKWNEDLRLYGEYGLNPYRALGGKILRKVPQFFNKPGIS